MSDRPFLSRWSRLKTQARKAPGETAPPPAAPAAASVSAPAAAEAPRAEPPPLPPIESLTPDSDFTPFLREGVEEGLKRQALRTLFRDPRFNVMDGLDVYIDDYSKPDPLPEGWLEQLNQYASLSPRPEPDPESQPGAEAATLPDANAVPERELAPPAGESPFEDREEPSLAHASDPPPQPDTPAKEHPQRE